MSHLGDRVAALVDGQLPIEATERAHSHLAHCRDCRDAVERERLMKARLSCLAGPAPDNDLISSLLAMGGPSGPLPPRKGHVPGSPRPMPVPAGRPAAPRPAGRTVSSRVSGPRPGGPGGPGRTAARPLTSAQARRRRARLAGAVLGALGVVGAGVGGLVLAGPATPTRGPAAPTLDSFVVRQATPARSTGRLPFTEQSDDWQVESVLSNTVPLSRTVSVAGGR